MAWQPGYIKRPWSTTLHGNWYSLEKKIVQPRPPHHHHFIADPSGEIGHCRCGVSIKDVKPA